MPPRKRIPPLYKQILAEHQARFNRVVVKAPRKLKAMYDAAEDKAARQLDRTIRAGRGATFTAHTQRLMLGQIRTGQAMVVRQLIAHSTDLAEAAQTEALRGLTRGIGAMEEKFSGTSPVLPVEEAARFYGIIDKNQTSLVRKFAGVPGKPGLYVRYGAAVIDRMEATLSESLMAGKQTAQITDELREIADLEYYQADRICRTELSWSYNASNRDGMAACLDDIPDLMHRWTENVDDYSGEPFDDKVAVDSLAMHGQVAEVSGGLFTQPADSPYPDAKGKTEVPFALVGQQWEFPPNRPNDRATTMPWRADWGIPAYRMVGGVRVDIL